MLLFIFTKLYRICRRYSFKYISCYCLSISRVRIRSTSLYSNTSHVIVYQWPSFFFFGFVWIQIHLMLLFIHNGEMVPYCISNSNTSHVIVYLATGGKGVRTFSIQIHLMLLFIQWFSCNHLSGFHIQIHLMLLFITRAARKKLVWDLFKYISCYCLSLTSLILSIIPLNSNTSHVIVYHTGVFCKNLRLRIQIHLMLLFIPSYLQPFLIQYTSKTFILQYISGILPAVCAVFQILHKRSKIPLFPSLLYIHVIKRLVKFIISGSLHFPHSHYLIFLLQIHCHS